MMRSRLRRRSPTGAAASPVVELDDAVSQPGGRMRVRRRMSADASEPGTRLGTGAGTGTEAVVPCVAPTAAAPADAAAADALLAPASLGEGGSGRPRLIIISSANKRSSFEKSPGITSSSASGRAAKDNLNE